MNELTVQNKKTAIEVKAQVNLIQEVMRSVMKKDVHYGVIPGCRKPTLYKPGSEKILTTFHLACEPVVEDLSTDDEIRYRVTTRLTNMATGIFVGAGIGECSSKEDKYQWRRISCETEWNVTDELRRREVWKSGKDGDYSIRQVRTNPSDIANTVLKMAKKRSQVDATLTATAASDIFDQDIEDLPEEMQPQASESHVTTKPPVQPPTAKPPTNGDIISELQRKRLYAIAMNAGMTKEKFKEWLEVNFKYTSSLDVRKEDYERICNEAGAYKSFE